MAAPVLTGEQLWVDGGGDGYCILVGSASVRVELIILMSKHAGGKPGKRTPNLPNPAAEAGRGNSSFWQNFRVARLWDASATNTISI